MYRRRMKAFTAILFLVLVACSGETKVETATAAPTETAAPAPTATLPQATAAAEPPGEATNGTWAGQVRIDAHAGIATLNYVGQESGDWVPMRFRIDSEAGKKILAACADEDLCEFEGAMRLLNELPPENASAVGEIVRVDRVKKLPPDAM